MAEINMEELVSVYNEVLNHDNRDNGIRLYVYKNKEDFINKYVEDNLIKMKISEPISTEKYENQFKSYLQEVNMIIKPFNEEQTIIVGVFGKQVDKIDIGNADVRLYSVEEIDLLVKDIEDYY